MFCDKNSDCGYFTYILCAAHWSPHHLAQTVLAMCRFFLVVWTSKLEVCYCLGLLPTLPPPPPSISFTHLFLAGLRFFLSPSSFFHLLPSSVSALSSSLLSSLLSPSFAFLSFQNLYWSWHQAAYSLQHWTGGLERGGCNSLKGQDRVQCLSYF